MGRLGARLADLTPLQRFSLLVALAFTVAATVLSLLIATVVERLVAEDTASQTMRELDEHYRVIFGQSIFERPLSPDEQRRFAQTVRFHLDVYDIVQATMLRPDGTIVYSYAPALIGTSAFDRPTAEHVRAALDGKSSYRVTSGGPRAGVPIDAGVPIMELWIPVRSQDRIVGAAEVYRDFSGLIAGVRAIQLIVTGVVVLFSIALFFSLRTIYVDSTRRLRRREAAERSARAQVAALEELARLKDEFVSQVSHELRTPLAPIVGYAELLAERDEPPETMHQYARAIQQQAAALQRLVDDLLDLSRLESGRYLLDRHRTSAGPLLANLVGELRHISAAHELRLDLPTDLPDVDVDPDRIRQVIGNLVTNAVRYSPAGGEIVVSARQVETDVQIDVRDSGIGIPADRLDRIFEKFYRVDNELTRHVSGTGLGLAICRELVESHGGRIWVASRPGAGSTFSFTLPAAAPIESSQPHLSPV